MGGRGSSVKFSTIHASSPKIRIQSTGSAPAQDDTQNPTPVIQQQPQSIAPTAVDFSSLTDDEFADSISKLSKTDMPAFLNSTRNGAEEFQAFVYKNNINSKPIVEDNATFLKNSKGMTKLYRTVNSNYDQKTDVGMTATDITDQFISGRLSRPGNGVYGQGYYFANTRSGSTSYGHTSGDIKKTAVMAAYLNSNAKVVSYGQAMRDLKKVTGGNSKLSNALLNMGNPNAAVSIMALRNGYNVIDNGRGYYVVLDRSAVTVNSKVTAK